jgi:predicted regulator of Ras-like GTPase activity (Roadblock/LC7/MglB family)
MTGIEEILRALRDVQGVHGSFVITGWGALVARDLPSAFDNQLFAEVGPRIARLHETFLSGGEELDACVLRFSEHKLYLRKMTSGLIGILSAVAVNMPALRMVSNLVIRRVDPEVTKFTALPQSAALTAPPPAAIVASPAQSLATSFDLPPSSRPTPTNPSVSRQGVVALDGRDPAAPTASERHVHMYRGRRVEE